MISFNYLKLYTMKGFLILIALTVISCGGSKDITSIQSNHGSNPYEVDFMKATNIAHVLDRAALENKLVYLDIGTKWCLPCQMMKEDVYTDKDMGTYLNSNFIPYLVDAEKKNGPDLTVIYEVTAYPTLLFLDTKGRVIERKVGAAYHRELKSMGDAALSQAGSRL